MSSSDMSGVTDPNEAVSQACESTIAVASPSVQRYNLNLTAIGKSYLRSLLSLACYLFVIPRRTAVPPCSPCDHPSSRFV